MANLFPRLDPTTHGSSRQLVAACQRGPREFSRRHRQPDLCSFAADGRREFGYDDCRHRLGGDRVSDLTDQLVADLRADRRYLRTTHAFWPRLGRVFYWRAALRPFAERHSIDPLSNVPRRGRVNDSIAGTRVGDGSFAQRIVGTGAGFYDHGISFRRIARTERWAG